jgi:hypothetical protein
MGADRHDVAGAAFPDAAPQLKAAVDFVAGGEGGADGAVMGLLEQAAGQFRLGRERGGDRPVEDVTREVLVALEVPQAVVGQVPDSDRRSIDLTGLDAAFGAAPEQ